MIVFSQILILHQSEDSHMKNMIFSDDYTYNYKRITLSDVVEERFYKIPKFLFTDPFKSVSNDAKIAYALLRDRNELSIKNNWVNERGEVYLLFTRIDLQNLLNISKNTCTKIMKELADLNLITEEKIGDKKPNKIYINTIVIVGNTNTYSASQNVGYEIPKKRDTQLPKCGTLDSQNLSPNDTNDYLTDFIETNQSINLNSSGLIDCYKLERERYSFEELVFMLKMDHLIEIHPDDQENNFKSNLINIVLDELNKPFDKVFINKELHISKTLFEDKIFKLTAADFEYIYEAFNKQKDPIRNIRSYLLTMVYNSSSTKDAYYANRINSELSIN